MNGITDSRQGLTGSKALARWRALAAIVTLLFATFTANAQFAPARQGLMYNLDMENVQIDKDRLYQGKSKHYGIATEGSGRQPEVQFDKTARSKVLIFRTGPTPTGQVKDRTELHVYSGVEFGQTWAMGMSVYIPEEVTFTDNWHLFMQCPQGGAPHPPLSLNLLAPDQLLLVSRTDENRFQRLLTTQMPKGRWVRLEIEFRMGEDGFVKFWKDGQLLTDQHAILRYKAGINRCHMKVGTYRGNAGTPHEIRFDDIRFGRSREAISLH